MTEARALWRAGKYDAALDAAWKAYDAAPDGRDEKYLVARFLRDEPRRIAADRGPSLAALLLDPGVDPASLSAAGWLHLQRDVRLFDDGSPEETARALEKNSLALTLLREDYVASLDVERALTGVRRWLLLGDHWSAFPALHKALIEQAALNGGAWPFDEQERARLAGPAALAYLPPKPVVSASAYADAVTRAVAEQYETWPYPAWTRITRPRPTSLAAAMHELDPDGPHVIAQPAEILVAGCGTGHHAALVAAKYPHDRVTAIDISEASLAYAVERCRAAGIGGIDFRKLDLYEAHTLGRLFDAVDCAGVLHHLPDPEKGWAALTGVLKPGGMMHVMVYSSIARLRVRAVRQALGEITARPVDDELLREIRRRVMAMPLGVPMSRDFHTLAGTHDLLVHRHEDPFDIPRICRALDALGLTLVRFDLPSHKTAAAYRERQPDDVVQRDVVRWREVERHDPAAFSSMYGFWCRKAL